MTNKYLTFISDEHLLNCISNLYNSYVEAKSNISKQKFYKNKVDTVKLMFDAKFNSMNEKALIQSEIARQTDKTINNAIGIFHEEVLGGIEGYERGKLDGYDIKALDNTLFADIKNKHNTMNSSSAEALYQKLEKFADNYPKSKCYCVQIWAKKSFCEPWNGIINGSHYNHERLFKISGDKFYELLSGQKDALYQLYNVLPKAIDEFLHKAKKKGKKANKRGSALDEITKSAEQSQRSIIDEITFENFGYYSGFDKLE